MALNNKQLEFCKRTPSNEDAYNDGFASKIG